MGAGTASLPSPQLQVQCGAQGPPWSRRRGELAHRSVLEPAFSLAPPKQVLTPFLDTPQPPYRGTHSPTGAPRVGRLHTGASSSASAVAAARSVPACGRCGAQMQQHGAVWSGTALPEHAQAPEPEPQGCRRAPAGDSLMACQKLLWNQPLAEQALTATRGPGIQLSAGSVPTAGGAKPGTSNPSGCPEAEGSCRLLATAAATHSSGAICWALEKAGKWGILDAASSCCEAAEGAETGPRRVWAQWCSALISADRAAPGCSRQGLSISKAEAHLPPVPSFSSHPVGIAATCTHCLMFAGTFLSLHTPSASNNLRSGSEHLGLKKLVFIQRLRQVQASWSSSALCPAALWPAPHTGS